MNFFTKTTYLTHTLLRKVQELSKCWKFEFIVLTKNLYTPTYIYVYEIPYLLKKVENYVPIIT